MLEKHDYINQITDALALLSRKVELSASLNLLDVNVVAEDFYKDFLNLALGYDLKNINEITPNAPAIDLGCTENRVAIQVTSTSALKKTRDTVTKFIEKNLHNDFDRLIILNLVKITKHKDNYVGTEGTFQIDTKKDMWDYTHLARIISSKDLDLLKQIVEFLQQQLKITSESPIPKEVKTIVALIDHLSNCENENVGNTYIDKPDPDGKIYNRFAEHAEFLTNTYVRLYNIYGANLDTVNELLDIGTWQFEKKSMYLQIYSDKTLSDCDGDPKIALETLTSHFHRIIHKKGIEVDETAITFYLVTELIRCNVFPNKITNA